MAFRKFIIISLITLLIAGCASGGYESTYAPYKKYTARQLYTKGSTAMTKKSYDDAVKYYEALDVLYPFGPYAQKGQFDIIKAYYKKGELESTIASADRYIHLYPQDRNLDYVYYIKGIASFERQLSWARKVYALDLSDRDLTTMNEAFADFAQLVEYYPQSQYVKDARQRMIYIRNLMAGHELHIAKFYFARKAYVAAANRAVYIVKHLEGTPQVIDALKIMVKSYRALGASQQAADALKVLKANYPTKVGKL